MEQTVKKLEEKKEGAVENIGKILVLLRRSECLCEKEGQDELAKKYRTKFESILKILEEESKRWKKNL